LEDRLKDSKGIEIYFHLQSSKDYKTKLFKMFCDELEGVYSLKDRNKQPFSYGDISLNIIGKFSPSFSIK
jgi:hypothetical protein